MQDVIKTALSETLAELGVSDVNNFIVEHPADTDHGDYASNVALVAFKGRREFEKAVTGDENTINVKFGTKITSPRTLAEAIKDKLEGQIEYIDRIEVAGPGFINFYLSRDFFQAELSRIENESDTWGMNQDWAEQTVVVEYTDPNPFKEFHVGHLFTNAVGESIARLFIMNGAEVKRVCYQGDVGLHVAHAIWGLQKLGVTAADKLDSKLLGKAYALGASAYKEGDEEVIAATRRINTLLYDQSDEDINVLYQAGRSVSLEYFSTIYERIGTHFDEYFFESVAGPVGKELVLKNPDVFPESEGAHIFDGESHGLHTRVFLNKEGLPTYEAKELALAKLKEDRLGNYDHSVIITANEITEYFKVLLKAMSFVYPDLASKTEHLGHGMVRLSTGKMSSRTGDVIPAVDFINEVAAAATTKMQAMLPDNAEATTNQTATANAIALAAIKYTTLKGSVQQDTIFDRERALSFEGDSGPYLQYTYARIGSVLERAATLNIHPSSQVSPDQTYAVEHLLYRFPEAVAEALAERSPHKVTGYLTELAGAFNTFYAQEKIADANDEYAAYKAAVAKAVAITLKNGLWVLGIEAPEKM